MPRLRGRGASEKLRLHVAGTPCIDWSAMGQLLGFNGPTAVIFECWVHERLFEEEDVIIHECTRNFPVSCLSERLGEKYVILSLLITPQEFGWPCSRPRRWTIMVKKSAYKVNVPYTLDSHGIAGLFGRAVELDGNAFFCAGREDQQEVFRAMAKKRKFSEESTWDCDDVLDVGSWARLQGHIRVANEMGKTDRDVVIVDLKDNAEHITRCISIVPTLLRKSLVYSLSLKRVMIPLEHLLVQGIPVIGDDFPHRCPFIDLIRAKALSHDDVKSLAGNCMHIGVVGPLVLYVLACLEPARGGTC
eukprot:408996-Pyramimonas_sp.AAC.1